MKARQRQANTMGTTLHLLFAGMLLLLGAVALWGATCAQKAPRRPLKAHPYSDPGGAPC